jgi:lysyl-tRNA synthetase class I
MSFKRKLFRFTRTAYVMNLMVTAEEQRIAEIKRKAERYEAMNKTTKRSKMKRKQRNVIKWYEAHYASVECKFNIERIVNNMRINNERIAAHSQYQIINHNSI